MLKQCLDVVVVRDKSVKVFLFMSIHRIYSFSIVDACMLITCRIFLVERSDPLAAKPRFFLLVHWICQHQNLHRQLVLMCAFFSNPPQIMSLLLHFI